MNDQTVTFKDRLQAFLYHFTFSIVLLLISMVFIFCIWYPGALKYATGVLAIYAMLLIIDLILGPLLTALVYKKNKIKFIFDMVIILIIQLSAFIFGLYTLEKGRPAWLVFVIDDFEIVSKSDLSPDIAIPNEFKVYFWEKPKWVAAIYSSDPKLRKRQQDDEIFNGTSLTTRPESYSNISLKYLAILDKSKSLDELKHYNNGIDKYQQEQLEEAYRWLPLKAPEKDMVVLINNQGQPTKIVNLRPWK